MDWSRAKTILIMSFLALNVLLGYELWSGTWTYGGSKEGSADVAEELNKLFVARGIRMTAEVPKDAPRMREIVLHATEGELYNRKVTLSTPIRYNLFISRGSLKDLANQPIPHLDSYMYDRVASRDGLFVMNQVAGEYPLFDITLELFVSAGEVNGYRQSFVQVEDNFDNQEEKKVISAYTVLRTLADKYLQTGTTITDIRLGYHGQFFDSDDWTSLPTFPTWRVAVDNGDIYYVHGFRGDVENATVAEADEDEA